MATPATPASPTEGFFVDWNGQTRRFERPGLGYTCLIRHSTCEGQPYLGVDVVDAEGFVTHEATFYRSLAALEAVGVTVDLVEEAPVTTPAAPALRLHVIDKDGNVLGYTACAVGLKTYAGPVTRFTDKTVWTEGKSGAELKHRKYDGNMPCVYRSHVRAADVVWNVAKA